MLVRKIPVYWKLQVYADLVGYKFPTSSTIEDSLSA